MRFRTLGFFLLLLLSSCDSFITTVKIEKRLPKIGEDKPFYIFSESFHTVPDSAMYLGTFSTEVELQTYLNPIQIENEIFASIEKKAKESGGNLVLVEKLSGEKFEPLIKGKIYYINEFEKSSFTENSIKEIWSKRKIDKIEGIYETDLSDFGERYRDYMVTYGIIKKDSANYLMIYLNGFNNHTGIAKFKRLYHSWKEGDIFAYIQKTEKKSIFKGQKYEHNKFLSENTMFKIDSGNLWISNELGLKIYNKIFPDSSLNETLTGILTGFAIEKNRIITCNHGLNQENIKIYVKGINGNFDSKYVANIEKRDKKNDIAIISLVDTTILNSYIPLPVSETVKPTAEDVFVLGYPIAFIMGEEIKLTNGIISSTSGVGGDMNIY